MTLRIEQIADDSETIFTLIGRITSPDVQQLKAEIAEARNRVTLDLEQVSLVDLDAVHFLAASEQHGIHLRNLPQYVREWILQEKPRVDELERDGFHPMDA
jgi:anti-anti-sigma regulatory factor